MMRVAVVLALILSLAGVRDVSAAPQVERFGVSVLVKRKSGIVCDLMGSGITQKSKGRFLGNPTISVAGDLGGASIVCTLADGSKIATQDHLGLFRGGVQYADVRIYPTRDLLRWGVLGALQLRSGPRDVSGFMTFRVVK
jgi:hypothetical protein